MRLGNTCLALGLWLCFNVILPLEFVRAASILAVFPYRLPQLFQVVRPLMKALTHRGHKITMITPLGMFEDIDGVRHIRVPMLNTHMNDMIESDKFQDFFSDKWSEGSLVSTVFHNISYAVLSNNEVQMMLQDRSQHFDMVLLEAGHMDALYGLAEFYNATLMGLCSVRINWNLDYLAGNPAPSILEPISPMGFSRENSFLSRLHNWIYISEERMLEYLVIRPSQQRILKKFFGYSAQQMDELRSRISFFLINNHFSMGRVRANVPNIIEIAGIHLSEPPAPCNKDLQRFLDDADDGVIYISMGNELIVKYLPESLQSTLLHSFSQLRQRVVWKTGDTTTFNQTGNIYRISQAPQRTILSHPNVRLFITNGGQLSLIEAIDSGVPMLGLPFFFDQFSNMHRMQLAGTAKVLDLKSLSSDLLTNTILELIDNPKYSQSAKVRARQFRDRPTRPLDTAVWWTEYALRHPDVSHTRLNQDEIPLMRYYRMDSLLSMGLRFGIATISVIWIISWSSCKIIKRIRQAPKKKEIVLVHINTPLNINPIT
ncbi:UDP-glycosyltransferase UGT4-like [Drosophila bipectinata]|uniref:UDP-glycosyltransferase UGT4-like n=1 Tax=Drosophila bipectinata TaxID=42026 RepID=UPI001C897330|nr:UDP-glycosyltransferase UGT4-like [Drosophila bipectinata]